MLLSIPWISLAFSWSDPAWIGIFVAFLAGILAAASPLLIVLFEKQTRRLFYKVISDVPLVQRDAIRLIDVRIPPNPDPIVTDINVLVLTIENTGTAAITDFDYNPALTFVFVGREVIGVTDVKTTPNKGVVMPENVGKSPRDAVPGWVSLLKKGTKDDPKYTLNPKSTVTLSILLNGPANRVEHSGGLSDGEFKEYVPQRGIRKRFIVAGIGTILLLGALLWGIFISITPPPLCVSGSINFGGSTALLPLALKAEQKYHEMCSQADIVNVASIASSEDGLINVRAGNINIGNSDLRSSNLSLVDHPVAVTTFVVVLNQSVTGITNLTATQIQGIYNGKITNWSKVGGPDLPIFVVNRTSTSGTRKTFEQYVLNGHARYPGGPRYLEVGTTSTMATTVATTFGAIGIMDVGTATRDGLQIVQIDGVEALPFEVESNHYKFWTVEHMYTKSTPTNLTTAFLNYIVGDQFKGVINDLAYVPYNSVPPNVISAHPSPLAPGGL